LLPPIGRPRTDQTAVASLFGKEQLKRAGMGPTLGHENRKNVSQDADWLEATPLHQD